MLAWGETAMRDVLATPAPSNGDRTALMAVMPSPAPSTKQNGKSFPWRIDPIGSVLLARRAVTEDQLRQAVEIQRESRGRLGRILVEMGAVSARELARAVAQQWGLSFAELSDDGGNPEVARLIPPALAQRHGVVAIDRTADRLVVAMADPSNVVAIDDVRLLTGLDVDVVIASPEDITRAQAQFFGIAADVEQFLKASGTPDAEVVETSVRDEEITLERLRSMVE